MMNNLGAQDTVLVAGIACVPMTNSVAGTNAREVLPLAHFLTMIKSVRISESIVETGATLTSKGQTTIPKQIRDSLGMKAGDWMTFTLMPDGTVLMRVKNKSVLSLAGSLHKKSRKALPIDQLSR